MILYWLGYGMDSIDIWPREGSSYMVEENVTLTVLIYELWLPRFDTKLEESEKIWCT